ncbi:splicing arginine serine-rich 12 [Mucor ambiguus]|uniref:Splicing arginine serine-rich 12 n=1 Tax=Mucor ambiguus TaxID=91626 RepID=A0A0C9MJM9_9FUNG|nr:splicing arginine serine-rich 12 [Mucor ambiguus]
MGSSKRHGGNSSSSSHKRRRESDEEHDRRSTIGEDDYFEKANEFRVWLKESKGKYLDEISSKEARRYFKKFVKRWNDYELDEKLYKGLNSAQLESSDTTRYKWSFAKNLNKMEMDTIRDNVDSMTSQSRGDDRVAGKRRAQAAGPTMPDTVDKEDRYERERLNRKHESKKRSERREAMLDEVAPKETGREAALAKKRALNAYHKRERSPDVELSEQDLMGGDDFKARLAAEKKANALRESRQAERQQQRLAPIMSKMDEYKAKEDATMAMFRQMAEERKRNGGF